MCMSVCVCARQLCMSVDMAWRTLCRFVCAYVRTQACERARGVVRESDAVSGVTLGLLVFLLSMKGMT